MKILYITHAGFDTPGPNNQMAEVMFNDWLNRGYCLDAIQRHSKGINPDIPKSLENRENFHCDTINSSKIDKSHFVKRYINDVKYYFQTVKFWRKQHYDVIFIQSGPTVVFLLILLKLFMRNTPVIYSIYDVFPGHAYDIGVIKSKFIYTALRFLQKPCYKIPSAITVLSEDMKNIVIKEGASANIIHIIPAWFDVKTAKEIPILKNRFIQKYDIDTSKFYVQFAGTIGYVFNYRTVIEVAKRLQNEPDIVFQIIGEGTTKQQFITEARSLKLNNISFYPLQPIEIVPDVYSACNVCMIPLMKGVIGNGVPSKVPILMACKRVILTAVEADSLYAKMFKENYMGLTADVYDYDNLAKSILWLKNNPDEVKHMVDNAYKFGQENYTSTASLEKLNSVFIKLLKV